MHHNPTYSQFLKNKVVIADTLGFHVREDEISPVLKPHQKAIVRWMVGETVFDPFGGIMSVPYRAILKGRKAIATELSTRYFMDGVSYCQAAEREMSMPDLFATLDLEKAA